MTKATAKSDRHRKKPPAAPQVEVDLYDGRRLLGTCKFRGGGFYAVDIGGHLIGVFETRAAASRAIVNAGGDLAEERAAK
jgi:hypothetical protein